MSNKYCFIFAKSQLFIEKAIPSIARSKSVTICGDSKQLRPTLFFESRYDDSDEDVEILNFPLHQNDNFGKFNVTKTEIIDGNL